MFEIVIQEITLNLIKLHIIKIVKKKDFLIMKENATIISRVQKDANHVLFLPLNIVMKLKWKAKNV